MCMLHVRLQASSSSFGVCASTHSMDLGSVALCVSEQQGRAGPYVSCCHFWSTFITQCRFLGAVMSLSSAARCEGFTEGL